jgi:hypothetical protein
MPALTLGSPTSPPPPSTRKNNLIVAAKALTITAIAVSCLAGGLTLFAMEAAYYSELGGSLFLAAPFTIGVGQKHCSLTNHNWKDVAKVINKTVLFTLVSTGTFIAMGSSSIAVPATVTALFLIGGSLYYTASKVLSPS